MFEEFLASSISLCPINSFDLGFILSFDQSLSLKYILFYFYRKDVDDVLQCFWLSNDYYDNAVQFFTKCQEVQLESEDATTNKEEF